MEALTANNFDGVVMFNRQEYSEERPIPYIADFTPTGMMTIAWDRQMQAVENPREIPKTKIAVDADIFEQGKKQRQLQQ